MRTKKSTKGDLESKKSTFLALGLVLAVGLVYVGMELFATQDNAPGLVLIDPGNIEIPVDVISTDQTPPPPPPPAPPVEAIISIVQRDVDMTIDIDKIFGVDINPNAAIEQYIEIEPIPEIISDDDPPIVYPTESPEFPGGNAALYKFLSDNLIYPKVAADLNLPGMVIVEFIIERDGKPSNVKINTSTAEVFNAEALRVVNAMPNWKPGKLHGKTVRTYYRLPINFQIVN
ncbi:MAG: energy transducer TonB [Bacteroidales bacterium]|jgi:protein TonB|nr:energy transducer TonB [Bacteroidales bacterium]